MYFPDYRKETDKLNEVDNAFISGYRKAIADAMSFFDNIDDEEALSIEKEVTEKAKRNLDEWMQVSEIEVVCTLFDEADYLPEDTKLVDANI
jgi:hypothetical protein